MKIPSNLPKEILRLNGELGNLDTKRGKILLKLAENLEWRKYRFMLFANDIINTYIVSDNDKHIKKIKEVAVTDGSIIVYAENIEGVITHKSFIVNDRLPYEAKAVHGLVTDGWKRLSDREAQKLANAVIDLKVKQLKEEIKKLESSKTK